jgi:cell division septation protein DedD
VWQRTDAEVANVQDAGQPARTAACKTVQEIEMSKGNRGNKEAKKPKRVVPVVKSPTTGTAAAATPGGAKPMLQKK